MMAKIESFKEETILASPPIDIDHNEDCDTHGDSELPVKETTYLQQAKRSVYYKKCVDIYKEILNINEGSDAEPSENSDADVDLNVFYSPIYAKYFLDNWCGLLPFWTCLHLGDQGRYGSSDVYKQWSDKYSSINCVKNPPRTQGIVELHQKSAKHISMNSKRERLDNVVANLFWAKISKHRQMDSNDT